ncbi:hypothetical protein ABZX90_36615 [Streptomyces sp. NPDC002935]|uniref:hypothetical protein n=1 Tax=Streptomyces sp. NPDC002935 TaxID=3154545 RepID=UPI0033A676E2
MLAAIGDGARSRMVADRLAQFQAAIVDFRQRVDAEARAFVARQLPHLYEQGAQRATESLSGRFTWTLIHTDALQSSAADSYADGPLTGKLGPRPLPGHWSSAAARSCNALAGPG